MFPTPSPCTHIHSLSFLHLVPTPFPQDVLSLRSLVALLLSHSKDIFVLSHVYCFCGIATDFDPGFLMPFFLILFLCIWQFLHSSNFGVDQAFRLLTLTCPVSLGLNQDVSCLSEVPVMSIHIRSVTFDPVTCSGKKVFCAKAIGQGTYLLFNCVCVMPHYMWWNYISFPCCYHLYISRCFLTVPSSNLVCLPCNCCTNLLKKCLGGSVSQV